MKHRGDGGSLLGHGNTHIRIRTARQPGPFGRIIGRLGPRPFRQKGPQIQLLERRRARPSLSPDPSSISQKARGRFGLRGAQRARPLRPSKHPDLPTGEFEQWARMNELCWLARAEAARLAHEFRMGARSASSTLYLPHPLSTASISAHGLFARALCHSTRDVGSNSGPANPKPAEPTRAEIWFCRCTSKKQAVGP